MADPTTPDTSSQAPKPLAVWRRAFLSVLAQTANVSQAARAAGVNRQYTYEARDNDPSFAAEWEEALQVAVDKLEERAWMRANWEGIQYKFTKEGSPLYHPVTNEPYFEQVGSDTVLLALLKAHRPEKYKDRSEVTGEVKVSGLTVTIRRKGGEDEG